MSHEYLRYSCTYFGALHSVLCLYSLPLSLSLMFQVLSLLFCAVFHAFFFLSRKEMSLIIIFTFLSILFSYLLPPSCASLQTHLQPSLFQQQANAHQHLSLPRLRKMRVAEQVEGYSEARDLGSHKQKAYLSGREQHHRKQNMALGNRETRQEWLNGEDPSQYFAKDYTPVGRRRPIHN